MDYQAAHESFYEDAAARDVYLTREEVVRAVNAALGDTVLYKIDWDMIRTGDPADQSVKLLAEIKALVQVHPKVDEFHAHMYDGIDGPCVTCGKKGFDSDS